MNYTTYSTNPRIKYSPPFSCRGTFLRGCGERYDPWEMKTYVSVDGQRRTFHSARAYDSNPSEDQVRKLTSFFEGEDPSGYSLEH